MIVAVIAVGVMQPTSDKVVDMTGVRHRLVAASAAMRVRLVARHGLGVAVGMRRVDSDDVLVDVIPVRVVHMAVVEVVDVIVVADRGVAATVAMTMRVWSVVNRMRHGATVQVGPATAKPLTTRTILPGLGCHRAAGGNPTVLPTALALVAVAEIGTRSVRQAGIHGVRETQPASVVAERDRDRQRGRHDQS